MSAACLTFVAVVLAGGKRGILYAIKKFKESIMNEVSLLFKILKDFKFSKR